MQGSEFFSPAAAAARADDVLEAYRKHEGLVQPAGVVAVHVVYTAAAGAGWPLAVLMERLVCPPWRVEGLDVGIEETKGQPEQSLPIGIQALQEKTVRRMGGSLEDIVQVREDLRPRVAVQEYYLYASLNDAVA